MRQTNVIPFGFVRSAHSGHRDADTLQNDWIDNGGERPHNTSRVHPLYDTELAHVKLAGWAYPGHVSVQDVVLPELGAFLYNKAMRRLTDVAQSEDGNPLLRFDACPHCRQQELDIVSAREQR